MKLKDIVSLIENIAPLQLQENYDNAGLVTGNQQMEVNAALLCIDVTLAVIDEAIATGANLIISHHPVIFSGLKKLTGNTSTEQIVIKAIQNNFALYSAHTNIDSVENGVSFKMAEKLGLINCRILTPMKGQLRKLVTFVPVEHLQKVEDAIFAAGAGHIGNYSDCSFQATGNGTFKALEGANPFVGELNQRHHEKEIRFETVFLKHQQSKIIRALLQAHPYEEVAYDVFALENQTNKIGFGVIGELQTEVDEMTFLEKIKKAFNLSTLKYTALLNKKIKKVALCGGAGSFSLQDAISENADIFISGDFKYHQFFDAENKIIIADIGHFESEQFTTEIFYDVLSKNIPNFAVQISKINTNPINYL